MALRVRYAMPGTNLGLAATRHWENGDGEGPGENAGEVLHSLQLLGPYTAVHAYARDTRCLGLTAQRTALPGCHGAAWDRKGVQGPDDGGVLGPL
eukprot:3908182-Rhodomonas_salina.12